MVLIGCSSEPKQTTVQGKVTWKGQPPNLNGLRISFIGADNKAKMADVAPNGDYTATVSAGDNLVAVSWQAPPEAFAQRARKPKKDEPAPQENPVNPELPISPIPIRYANPASSGLKCVLEVDKANTYNVDLGD